jgi:hypothetical protein
MLHPGFLRYYDDALLGLAKEGHRVHVAFEISREKLQESLLAGRLASGSDRVTCGQTPPRSESVREFLVRSDRSATRSGELEPDTDPVRAREGTWESLATTVRLLLDCLRFFEPAFSQSGRLRDRAEKRLPRVYVPLVRTLARCGARARRSAAAALRAVERLIPTNASLDAFIRDARPDLVLVTPLVELGSQQVDYVKCARKLGVRSALCVASWDNLTSKGLIRVVPDHVIVWNAAQAQEAVTLHGVPAERVIVTGAQVFDRWFAMRPSLGREEFCGKVGLDPERPFVLYAGSSSFVAPEEAAFAERWTAAVRASRHPHVASAGILIRPHPANARQWRTFDTTRWPNVALWPAIDSQPDAPEARSDYFDSLHHSAVVVGVNTSAQLEAGIVGRPVLTIRASEFAHSQDGTLHFRHLVDPEGGFVRVAGTLDEHLDHLAEIMGGSSDAAEANRRFVRAFIRPHGEEAAAVPRFVEEVARLAGLPSPPPEPDSWLARALRPGVYLVAVAARLLAEDRPLWVYLLRPWVALTTHVVAIGMTARAALLGPVRLRGKRLRRAGHRVWYESTSAIRKRWRRVMKPMARVARQAGGSLKRAVRRQS